MEPRTSSAIAQIPSINKQVGHYFLSLHTGKRILRNNWTEVPMPNEVVDAVHTGRSNKIDRRHNIH